MKPRTKVLRLRVNERDLRIVRALAERKNTTLSEAIRSVLLETWLRIQHEGA